MTTMIGNPVAGNDDIRNWQQNNSGYVSVPDEEEGERIEEVPPTIPTPTLGGGLRKLRDRAQHIRQTRKEQSRKPVRTSRAPRPRVAVDKLIGHAWTILARVVAPISIPMARVLEVQAPVAGMVLEDVVKNTVVDKLLQPIARIEGGGEVAFALVGPPLLVGALTRKPEMAPVLIPLLRESLRAWIEIAGPKMEKVQRQDAEFAEKYGRKIDEMIAYFLAPVEVEATNANNGNQPHG